MVDTAAQVTIMSDKVYNTLKQPPSRQSEVKFRAAGREMEMNGFQTSPFQLTIGNKNYNERVYVAPIEQDMLLGFDILHGRGQAILDLGKGILHFDGMDLELDGDPKDIEPKIARVTVAKRTRIPPNSAVLVRCKMDT